MQRRRRNSGISLVEILIVIGILLMLSGIIFAATQCARRSAKHAHCKSNLRQIYMAGLMYGDDHDGLTLYPELHGFAYTGGHAYQMFKAYGIDGELKFCPSAPAKLKSKIFATYSYIFVAGTSLETENGVPSFRKLTIEEEARVGDRLPIAMCHIHDTFEFYPSDKNPKADPYLLIVRANGSISPGRTKERQRTLVFKDIVEAL